MCGGEQRTHLKRGNEIESKRGGRKEQMEERNNTKKNYHESYQNTLKNENIILKQELMKAKEEIYNLQHIIKNFRNKETLPGDPIPSTPVARTGGKNRGQNPRPGTMPTRKPRGPNARSRRSQAGDRQKRS